MIISDLIVGELYVDCRYGIIRITELYEQSQIVNGCLMGDLFGKYETVDGLKKFLIFEGNSIEAIASDKDIVNFIEYNSKTNHICQYKSP
jgi:hypothetical protein